MIPFRKHLAFFEPFTKKVTIELWIDSWNNNGATNKYWDN